MEYIRPEIYHFMDERFIDEFINNGRLRLSSLNKMRELEGERGDELEGCFFQEIENERMNLKVLLQSDKNEGVFIFCASLSPLAFNPKGHSYCLKITNIEKFAEVVGYELERRGFEIESIVEGPCNYAGRFEQFTSLQSTNDENEMKQYINKITKISRGVSLFQKAGKYMCEHEYRIAWYVKNGNLKEHVDLANVNGVASFAEKIEVPHDFFAILHNLGILFYMRVAKYCDMVRRGCNKLFSVKRKLVLGYCSRLASICRNLFYAVRVVCLERLDRETKQESDEMGENKGQ